MPLVTKLGGTGVTLTGNELHFADFPRLEQPQSCAVFY